MINPKISILLTTIGVFTFFELFYYYPKSFYLGLFLVNLILILTLRTLPKLSFSKKNYWNFLILPFLFLNSSAAYLSLLTGKFLIHVLIVLIAIFIYFYLRQIYLFQKFKHQNVNLTNITSFGTVLVMLFSTISLYGLRAALHLPIWFLILVLLIICSLLSYKSFWINGIKIKENLFYLIIITLIVLEIAWALFFLSFSYIILGAILTICYYIIIGLTKFHLRDCLDSKRLKFYLGFGLSSILLILLTSKII